MTSTFVGRQRFDLGRVIERTFGAIGDNAATLLLSALLFVGVPQAIWGLVSINWTTSLSFGMFTGVLLAIAGMVISMVCNVLLQGVVTHTVVSDLLSRKATMSESMEAALRSFWMLLGVGIASGLSIGLGLVFLIVPGIFLMLIWFVVGPVVVAERAGFGQAFERSLSLTENHRWMLLLLAVIYLVASWVIMMMFGMVTAMVSGGLLAAASPVAVVINAIIQAIVSLVAAAGVAAVYVELRTVKDGGGREGVAALFE